MRRWITTNTGSEDGFADIRIRCVSGNEKVNTRYGGEVVRIAALPEVRMKIGRVGSVL